MSLIPEEMQFTMEHASKLLKHLGFPENKVKYGSVSLSGIEGDVLLIQLQAFVSPRDLAEAWKPESKIESHGPVKE